MSLCALHPQLVEADSCPSLTLVVFFEGNSYPPLLPSSPSVWMT